MNTIMKFCRQNINKIILYQPTRLLNISQCNKLVNFKLYNNTSNSIMKTYTFKLILSGGILTWLGFTKEDEEKESELIMTIKRSILLMQRGEYPKSEQMLHLALKLAQEQQNQQAILYVYDVMANLALERGEADKAHTLFVSVLQRLLSEGMKQDDIKVIHISLKLARICEMKGESEKAEIGYKWCLDSIKKKESEIQDNDVKALNGVVQDWYAQYLLKKGQVNDGLNHLKEAYLICSEIEGDYSEKSVLLLNDLGTVSWKLGDLTNAEDYLNRAVKFGKSMDDFYYLSVIYSNLGMVYLQKGILDEAKKYCKEGYRLAKKQKSEDAEKQANYCFEQIRIHA